VKEAFAKALDGARGVGWHEVQVRRAASGRPILELTGNASAMVERFGADTWHVSITHDAGVAVAVVILEQTKPRKSEDGASTEAVPGDASMSEAP
jgi:holo-[acyl-carrier protein] synthase